MSKSLGNTIGVLDSPGGDLGEAAPGGDRSGAQDPEGPGQPRHLQHLPPAPALLHAGPGEARRAAVPDGGVGVLGLQAPAGGQYDSGAGAHPGARRRAARRIRSGVREVLERGAAHCRVLAEETMARVRDLMGFVAAPSGRPRPDAAPPRWWTSRRSGRSGGRPRRSSRALAEAGGERVAGGGPGGREQRRGRRGRLARGRGCGRRCEMYIGWGIPEAVLEAGRGTLRWVHSRRPAWREPGPRAAGVGGDLHQLGRRARRPDRRVGGRRPCCTSSAGWTSRGGAGRAALGEGRLHRPAVRGAGAGGEPRRRSTGSAASGGRWRGAWRRSAPRSARCGAGRRWAAWPGCRRWVPARRTGCWRARRRWWSRRR